jgi:hypothetical protein
MVRHNHLAVWVSIILSQILGYVTYTHLFAKQWIEGQPLRWPNGMENMDKMEGGEMATPFVIDIIGSILLCYFLSWLIIKLGINTASRGFMLGIMIVGGLLIKAMLSHYAFLGMSWAVTLIDFGFTSVVVLVACMIIGGWRKKESAVVA